MCRRNGKTSWRSPLHWQQRWVWCRALQREPSLGFEQHPLCTSSPIQLREYLRRAGSKLRWVASDHDLSGSLTKKRADCRVGFQKFLKTWLWAVGCQIWSTIHSLQEEQRKEGKTAVNQIDNYLKGGKPDLPFYAGATTSDPCQVCHVDMMKHCWPLTALYIGSGGAHSFFHRLNAQPCDMGCWLGAVPIGENRAVRSCIAFLCLGVCHCVPAADTPVAGNLHMLPMHPSSAWPSPQTGWLQPRR